MKKAIALSLFCYALGMGSAWAASGTKTHAGQAVRESGAASVHASGSAAHALVASGQVTSAVASVPLAMSGVTLTAVGKASTSASIELHKAASAPVDAPLPVADEYLMTIPPDQALQQP